MTVYNFSPFNNENLIAGIKFEEESRFVDQFHISECDKNFRYKDKGFQFEARTEKTFHHKISGKKNFKGNILRLQKKPWFFTTKVNPWNNEKIQRDYAIKSQKFSSEDILIFSDIDEIIDSKVASKLISAARKHGIITVKLHYTMYFFNLFSMNWYGPPDYSYRVFIMTGEYYNSHKISIDKLRKLGEGGKLLEKVFCYPDFAGFHHSWLGDPNFLINKLNSYSHDVQDHHANIYSDNTVDPKLVANVYKNLKSVYGDDHKLAKRDDVTFLRSVMDKKSDPTFSHLFLA